MRSVDAASFRSKTTSGGGGATTIETSSARLPWRGLAYSLENIAQSLNAFHYTNSNHLKKKKEKEKGKEKEKEKTKEKTKTENTNVKVALKQYIIRSH